jgi:hypothetical protein
MAISKKTAEELARHEANRQRARALIERNGGLRPKPKQPKR